MDLWIWVEDQQKHGWSYICDPTAVALKTCAGLRVASIGRPGTAVSREGSQGSGWRRVPAGDNLEMTKAVTRVDTHRCVIVEERRECGSAHSSTFISACIRQAPVMLLGRKSDLAGDRLDRGFLLMLLG